MATLDTIAKIAGVNKTTVSKALRNSADINKETAARIKRIAAECGYKIKPKKNGFNIIGVICPEIKSDYYSQIIELLNDTFLQNGYHCIVMLSNFDTERERKIIDILAGNRVLGLVCITESDGSNYYLTQVSREKNIPIIQVAVNAAGANIDSICINDDKCISYALRHLMDLGHKKIAFFGDRFAGARLKYFTQYAREYGIFSEKYIFIDKELRHAECGYKLTGDLLALKDRPTAIIAEYDNIALGAIRRLAEKGYSVPEDFSVIGCDNSSYTSYLPKSLTTIDGHNAHLCEIVVAILKKKISDISYKVVQNVQISPELIVRESTGPLKKED
jgi:LacI family transcriptional regulator